MSKKTLVLVSLTHLEKPVKVLKSLTNTQWVVDEFDIYAVVNDRKGRLIKELESESIPYEVCDDVHNIKPELDVVCNNINYIVSCGWGWKIRTDSIQMATDAAINCHSSLLPDYRGPSVFRAQWAHAEPKGGATIHYLNEGFDDGNIITQGEFSIRIFDTPEDIRKQISETTACILREALLLLENGYEGEENSGGRYFTGETVTSNRIYLYRTVNLLFRTTGSQTRVYLPSE